MSLKMKNRSFPRFLTFLVAVAVGGLAGYFYWMSPISNAGVPSGAEQGGASSSKEDGKSEKKPKSLATTSKMSKLDMKYNELTEKEAEVILYKGTERPWVGEYTDNKRKGTYICRRCNAPLYKSESKFDSHCGWPSFDDEIKGAVARHPDADGHRTEIVCKNCDGHLGHVFLNEGFTAKNTRHCVNSISMRFIEAGKELPAVVRHEEKELKEEKAKEEKASKNSSRKE